MTIPKKRKLSDASSRFGAPMGRRNILPTNPDAPITLRLELLPWVDGDYDEGGAYFGGDEKTHIYWAYGEDDQIQAAVFVRATDADDALHQVLAVIPGAEFCDPQPEDIDDFTQAYIECALWLVDDKHEFRGKQQCDIAEETLAEMVADCKKFQAENDLTDYPLKNAGHDLFLTRQHAGCGFWENDFGTEEQCKKLTDAAHTFGEVNLYVGDDGKIYC